MWLVEWILDSQAHIFHLSHASRRLYGGIPHFAGIRRSVKAIEFFNCDICVHHYSQHSGLYYSTFTLVAEGFADMYSNFIWKHRLNNNAKC